MEQRDPSPIRQLALRDPRAAFFRRWVAAVVDIPLAGLLILSVNRLIPAAAHERNQLLGGIVAVALSLAYFWIPEALWGVTAGKLLARVRVVAEGGESPGFGRALVRTLLRIAEVNPLLLGGIPAALVAYRSKAGQRLGDMLARTYVLRTSDLRSLEGP